MLNNRINSYTDMIGIMAEEQNGFRMGRSCEDHIFTVSTIIKNKLSSSKCTFTCFIDMQKAFDSVDRDLLFHKLISYNITGKIFWAIKSMYVNIQSCLQLNEIFTDWFSVLNGVKQGDNLSPTLFALFINDLVNECGCSTTRLTFPIKGFLGVGFKYLLSPRRPVRVSCGRLWP